MSAVLLSLENVTTYYAQMRILEGISLQVGEGELVCLLGGGFWLAREARQFRRVWVGLMEIAQPGGSR